MSRRSRSRSRERYRSRSRGRGRNSRSGSHDRDDPYKGRRPPNIRGMVSLKVDNLSYRITPEELKPIFEHYGDVGDIYIPRDRFTKESRGFAFVRFFDRRDAEDAMQRMDGYVLDGREMRVQTARYGRPAEPPHIRYGRDYVPNRDSNNKDSNNRDSNNRDSNNRDSHRDQKDQRDHRRKHSRSHSRSYSPKRRSASHSPKRRSASHSPKRTKRSYSRSYSRERSPVKKWSSSPERNNKSAGSVDGSRNGSRDRDGSKSP